LPGKIEILLTRICDPHISNQIDAAAIKHQSGLKLGIVGPGLKIGGDVGPKCSTDAAT